MSYFERFSSNLRSTYGQVSWWLDELQDFAVHVNVRQNIEQKWENAITFSTGQSCTATNTATASLAKTGIQIKINGQKQECPCSHRDNSRVKSFVFNSFWCHMVNWKFHKKTYDVNSVMGRHFLLLMRGCVNVENIFVMLTVYSEEKFQIWNGSFQEGQLCNSISPLFHVSIAFYM